MHQSTHTTSPLQDANLPKKADEPATALPGGVQNIIVSENSPLDKLMIPAFTDAKSIPHNTPAEQALLGLLMFNNQLFDNIEGELTANLFYVPLHGAIFESIQGLVLKGWEASPITVHAALKSKPNVDGAELMQALTAMLDMANSATDVRALSEIIRHTHLQRQLMGVADTLKRDAPSTASLEEASRVINEAESALFKLQESGPQKRAIQNLVEPLKAVLKHAETAKARKSHLTGVSTGIGTLNQMLGGWQRSDLIILGARPSMGKTAFAVNLAFNAAHALMNEHEREHGCAVGFFSLEMSAEQLAARILSVTTGVDASKLQNGSLNDNDFERLVAQANSLSDLQIYIDDTPQLHINMLRARARRMVRQHNVRMLVVDYLQLMRGDGNRGDFNRVQEITTISLGLKGIARELDVPVIALAQLSRGVEARENKRPQLSDLRESGSIEQDADVVMFLYREDYYLSKEVGTDPTPEQRERLEAVKGKTELLISKNRKGATGAIKMIFNPATTSFEGIEEHAYGEHQY